MELLAALIQEPTRLWQTDSSNLNHDLRTELGFMTTPLTASAAFAASCLLDLCEMHQGRHSPMAAPTPFEFLQACSGTAVKGVCNTWPPGSAIIFEFGFIPQALKVSACKCHAIPRCMQLPIQKPCELQQQFPGNMQIRLAASFTTLGTPPKSFSGMEMPMSGEIFTKHCLWSCLQ